MEPVHGWRCLGAVVADGFSGRAFILLVEVVVFCGFFQLVVHVGVSGIAKELTLEQGAHNDGYDKPDIRGLLPPDQCCVNGCHHYISSRIDMTGVCEAVNGSDCGVHAVVSNDPGR